MNGETLKLVHNRQTMQMKKKAYKLEQVVLTCKGQGYANNPQNLLRMKYFYVVLTFFYLD